MRYLKRTFLRVFFVMELFVFMYMYFFGANGLRIINQIKATNAHLDQDINVLKEEVKTLEHEIIAWNKDPFYKEKIARERLHMARKNEVVYYIDSTIT